MSEPAAALRSFVFAVAVVFSTACRPSPDVEAGRSPPPHGEKGEPSFQSVLGLAEAGDRDAQFSVAQKYNAGRGVPEDDRLALHWYQKAAANGNVDAVLKLAEAYAGPNRLPGAQPSDSSGSLDPSLNLYRQVTADFEKSKKMVIDLANQTHYPPAIEKAFLIMDAQQNGSPDQSDAFFWIKLGAALGMPKMQARLADRFATGLGVSKDLVIAQAWSILANPKNTPAQAGGSVAAIALSAKWRPGDVFVRIPGDGSHVTVRHSHINIDEANWLASPKQISKSVSASSGLFLADLIAPNIITPGIAAPASHIAGIFIGQTLPQPPCKIYFEVIFNHYSGLPESKTKKCQFSSISPNSVTTVNFKDATVFSIQSVTYLKKKIDPDLVLQLLKSRYGSPMPAPNPPTEWLAGPLGATLIRDGQRTVLSVTDCEKSAKDQRLTLDNSTCASGGPGVRYFLRLTQGGSSLAETWIPLTDQEKSQTLKEKR